MRLLECGRRASVPAPGATGRALNFALRDAPLRSALPFHPLRRVAHAHGARPARRRSAGSTCSPSPTTTSSPGSPEARVEAAAAGMRAHRRRRAVGELAQRDLARARLARRSGLPCPVRRVSARFAPAAPRGAAASAIPSPRPASRVPMRARSPSSPVERLISRTHFARFLVEAGHVRSPKDVFRRYLLAGQAGPCRARVGESGAGDRLDPRAGGQAVLAHPGRYPLQATALRELLNEFRAAGGDGIEVLSPSHTAAEVDQLRAPGAAVRASRPPPAPTTTARAKAVSTWATCRSLPAGVVPVWQDW